MNYTRCVTGGKTGDKAVRSNKKTGHYREWLRVLSPKENRKKEETLSSPLFLYFSTLSMRTLLILLFRYCVGLGFIRRAGNVNIVFPRVYGAATQRVDVFSLILIINRNRFVVGKKVVFMRF